MGKVESNCCMANKLLKCMQLIVIQNLFYVLAV